MCYLYTVLTSNVFLQVSTIKKQYPGIVLMFEVGYRCLLFEEDAEVPHHYGCLLSSLMRMPRLDIESLVYRSRRKVIYPLPWSLWNVEMFT